MATYLPSCEGIPHLASKFLCCQSECALPAKSTYSSAERWPVGLVETKKPLPSAAQSRDNRLFQSFRVIVRDGWPMSEIKAPVPAASRLFELPNFALGALLRIKCHKSERLRF